MAGTFLRSYRPFPIKSYFGERMQRFIFALLLMTLLSACAGAPANKTLEPALPSDTAPVPTETTLPVIPSDTAPAPTPTAVASNPKLPAAPFEAQTYINEEVGFALDYPSGWTVNETIVGPRGT